MIWAVPLSVATTFCGASGKRAGSVVVATVVEVVVVDVVAAAVVGDGRVVVVVDVVDVVADDGGAVFCGAVVAWAPAGPLASAKVAASTARPSTPASKGREKDIRFMPPGWRPRMQIPWARCDEIVKNRAMATLSTDTYLAHITAAARLLAETLNHDSTLPVPSCPGWDLARLAGHVGRVHRMATTVVSTQATTRPDPSDREAPPLRADDLAAWLVSGAETLVGVLGSTPHDSPAWNFTNAPQTAVFWPRRQAHETAVHRYDGQLAISASGPENAIDTELAIDGIDEFFDIYGGRIQMTHPGADLGGALHLHATDGPGEWMIAMNEGALTIKHGHGKGDAAVRGTASDLMLGLWGRWSLFDEARFEHFGDRAIVSTLIDLTKA